MDGMLLSTLPRLQLRRIRVSHHGKLLPSTECKFVPSGSALHNLSSLIHKYAVTPAHRCTSTPSAAELGANWITPVVTVSLYFLVGLLAY